MLLHCLYRLGPICQSTAAGRSQSSVMSTLVMHQQIRNRCTLPLDISNSKRMNGWWALHTLNSAVKAERKNQRLSQRRTLKLWTISSIASLRLLAQYRHHWAVTASTTWGLCNITQDVPSSLLIKRIRLDFYLLSFRDHRTHPSEFRWNARSMCQWFTVEVDFAWTWATQLTWRPTAQLKFWQDRDSSM